MMISMESSANTPVEPPPGGAGIIAYQIDVATETLHWGEGLRTVLGYDITPETSTLEWWAHHVHPEDALILNDALDILQHQWVNEWTVSYRFQRADTTYVRVHDRAMVTRDQAGNAVRLTGTIWLAQADQKPIRNA